MRCAFVSTMPLFTSSGGRSFSTPALPTWIQRSCLPAVTNSGVGRNPSTASASTASLTASAWLRAGRNSMVGAISFSSSSRAGIRPAGTTIFFGFVHPGVSFVGDGPS